MAKWKCKPCGHITEEKPGEICLICKTPTSGAMKIVSKGGKIKHIGREKGLRE